MVVKLGVSVMGWVHTSTRPLCTVPSSVVLAVISSVGGRYVGSLVAAVSVWWALHPWASRDYAGSNRWALLALLAALAIAVWMTACGDPPPQLLLMTSANSAA